MSKTGLLKRVGTVLHRNAPEILLGTGIAGFLTTVILAVRATPKAMIRIEEAKEELKSDKLTPVETVKATWKCYIPTTLAGAGSVVCLICAHSTNARRNAALAAAYSLSETALKEYQEKVVETVGEKKEQAIRDSVDKDRIDAKPASQSYVLVTNLGSTLCYDYWGDRYFTSDIEKIRKAVNDINLRMRDEMYVSLNDFYDELCLPGKPFGDDLGWNINRDGYVEVRFSAQITDDGRPCIVLDFVKKPVYDYLR